MSYNTSQQASTWMTSYYLMFERDLKLPIKEITLSKETILDRIIELIHKASIFRESIRAAINRVQQRIKANYLVQQTKKFAVKDQVLYDDSLNYHGKLDSK